MLPSAPPGTSGAWFYCGAYVHIARDLWARHVFNRPDIARLTTSSQASDPSSVIVASGPGCTNGLRHSAAGTRTTATTTATTTTMSRATVNGDMPIAGRVIYVDGESGNVMGLHVANESRVIYIGPLGQIRNGRVAGAALRRSLRPGMRVAHLHAASIATGVPWQHRVDWSRLLWARRRQHRGTLPRRFLAYASSHCVKTRERTFATLVDLASRYGMELPHALGKCDGWRPAARIKGHSGGFMRERAANVATFSDYKFVLCMENADVPYYVTEKMLTVFASGAVPVYWGGGGVVHEVFDARTFIYIDPRNPEAAFQRMRVLHASPAAYEEATSRPIFRAPINSTVERFFSMWRGGALGGTGTLGARVRAQVHQFLRQTGP